MSSQKSKKKIPKHSAETWNLVAHAILVWSCKSLTTKYRQKLNFDLHENKKNKLIDGWPKRRIYGCTNMWGNWRDWEKLERSTQRRGNPHGDGRRWRWEGGRKNKKGWFELKPLAFIWRRILFITEHIREKHVNTQTHKHTNIQTYTHTYRKNAEKTFADSSTLLCSPEEFCTFCFLVSVGFVRFKNLWIQSKNCFLNISKSWYSDDLELLG